MTVTHNRHTISDKFHIKSHNFAAQQNCVIPRNQDDRIYSINVDYKTTYIYTVRLRCGDFLGFAKHVISSLADLRAYLYIIPFDGSTAALAKVECSHKQMVIILIPGREQSYCLALLDCSYESNRDSRE